MKLKLSIKRVFLPIFAIILFVGFGGIFSAYFMRMNKNFHDSVYKDIDEVKTEQEILTSMFDEMLFEDHLKLSQNLGIQNEIADLQENIAELLTVEENENYDKILDIQKNYQKYTNKLDRNEKLKIDVGEYTESISSWGTQLLEQEYDEILTDIEAKTATLEEDYDEYIASLPPPPKPAAFGEGYSYQTVQTERGTFGVYLIKVPMSSVKVVTAAASGDDCKDGCPTKSLAQHVQDNGGYAGMNGSYFCPPDYSSCGGKINSFDYALYKSSGKWINKGALSWGDTGLATFRGNSAKFYKKSSDYGSGSVTAGISNYPTLLDNKEVVIKESKLTSYQKDVKGMRGAIGVGGTNLYLAHISNATVIDAAYVMKALGAIDALNLDGGGSSAMYIDGGYVVGPGRSLPNAVVLVK
jgi:exopolysaccharide biosynthesis protein